MKRIRLLGTLLLMAFSHAIFAQTVRPGVVQTDDYVSSFHKVGDKMFVGGRFINLSQTVSDVLIYNASSGQYEAGVPQPVGGNILDATPDGNGGWFVFGDFTSIGGVTCDGLAHILPWIQVINATFVGGMVLPLF